MMTWMDRLRLWLLKIVFPKRTWSVSRCANRVTWRSRIGSAAEVTLTIRHLSLPDGHSREELVEMLEIVRREEDEMGWRVPEPTRAG